LVCYFSHGIYGRKKIGNAHAELVALVLVELLQEDGSHLEFASRPFAARIYLVCFVFIYSFGLNRLPKHQVKGVKTKSGLARDTLDKERGLFKLALNLKSSAHAFSLSPLFFALNYY